MKLGIIIGRFEIFHKGHLHLISSALKQLGKEDRLIVMIGSSYRARSPKNPWTESERIEMISSTLGKEGLLDHRIMFRPIRDFMYSDTTWTAQVAVATILPNLQEQPECILFGFKKDDSSYYLDLFPQWKYVEIAPSKSLSTINATDIRNLYFQSYSGLEEIINLGVLPKQVEDSLDSWRHSPDYLNIQEEYHFYLQYKREAEVYRYPITYVTVDAVIHFRNFCLLIERRAYPGKGLWALPGGFVGPNERLLDAAIRETKEETGLRLRREWLAGRFVADHPNRSLRGRTISHCFAFKYPDNLPDYMLPDVAGQDDAARAQWRHINDIRHNLESMLYEDHLDIINELWSRF